MSICRHRHNRCTDIFSKPTASKILQPAYVTTGHRRTSILIDLEMWLFWFKHLEGSLLVLEDIISDVFFSLISRKKIFWRASRWERQDYSPWRAALSKAGENGQLIEKTEWKEMTAGLVIWKEPPLWHLMVWRDLGDEAGCKQYLERDDMSCGRRQMHWRSVYCNTKQVVPEGIQTWNGHILQYEPLVDNSFFASPSH